MQLASLLNAIPISVMETGYKINLDVLGQFARVIIEGVGIIGLGIIVFTLVLKAITLPFDIYQRVKMRKQTLIMRNMKDDLEKLQKQYANDKNMYNQKMVELQKKNGYSVLGACLPMIISLVILIVAFQGFRTYSNYANLQTFKVMSEHYNTAILEYCPPIVDFKTEDIAGKGATWTEDGVIYEVTEQETEDQNKNPVVNQFLKVTSADENKFLYYEYNVTTQEGKKYSVDEERFYKSVYFNETMSEEKRNEIVAAPEEAAEGTASKSELIRDEVERIGARAAATYFREEKPTKFLWIGNVWFPDVSYEHPIPKTYSALKKTVPKTVRVPDPKNEGKMKKVNLDKVLAEDQYNALVLELEPEQRASNGYFILIILSIGLMVVSQVISMKSNKESNKYQTVDGRGSTTQKVMLVVMPLIYGMFAFFYSAAFSIYMCVSSISAILVTLLSNLVIGHVFNKKEEAKFKAENSRRLPWMDQNGKNGAKADKSKKAGKGNEKKKK